jgi:hypothetical protein
LRSELAALWRAHNKATDGGTQYLGEYLEVIAIRDAHSHCLRPVKADGAERL